MIELDLPDYDGNWTRQKFKNNDTIDIMVAVEQGIDIAIWLEKNRIIELFEDEIKEYNNSMWVDAIRIIKYGRKPYGGEDE